MEFKILNQKKNVPLEREEYAIEVKSINNPTKEEVLGFLKKGVDVCEIKTIKGNFGRNVFKAEVFVYDSPEAKLKIEYLPQKVRKKLEEEKKKAAEAQAKAEEEKKKAEEEAKAAEAEKPKEEVKTEEKKE
jgi:ribosomal protein S24E